jgi:capsule biosynthesis phosphatase
MIKENNVLVFDIDGTICLTKKNTNNYLEISPNNEIVSKLINYKKNGFYIILYTSRNMRTFQGNIGQINAKTAKDLFDWLHSHNIPYDEIHFGKPWCGYNGFYIDDRAIRPSEFIKYSFEELNELINKK